MTLSRLPLNLDERLILGVISFFLLIRMPVRVVPVDVFGNLAILVTFVTLDPLALRPRLSPGLPYSVFLPLSVYVSSHGSHLTSKSGLLSLLITHHFLFAQKKAPVENRGLGSGLVLVNYSSTINWGSKVD